MTTGKLRRSPNGRELADNVIDSFRNPVGLAQAVRQVARFRPDVVFSTGVVAAMSVSRTVRVPSVGGRTAIYAPLA